MKSNEMPASKTDVDDKMNEKNVLQFLNKEIEASDPAQDRKTQNDDLDLVVSNLLKQAIAESDKRIGDSESKEQSEKQTSVHPGSAGESPAGLISESDIETEFGMPAGSKDASTSANGVPKPQEAVRPETTEIAAQEIPGEAACPADDDPVEGMAEQRLNERPLFSGMEAVNKIDGTHTGKSPSKQYVLIGLIVVIGIAIGLTAYFKNGNAVVDTDTTVTEPVGGIPDTVEGLPENPVLPLNNAKGDPGTEKALQGAGVKPVEEAPGSLKPTPGADTATTVPKGKTGEKTVVQKTGAAENNKTTQPAQSSGQEKEKDIIAAANGNTEKIKDSAAAQTKPEPSGTGADISDAVSPKSDAVSSSKNHTVEVQSAPKAEAATMSPEKKSVAEEKIQNVVASDPELKGDTKGIEEQSKPSAAGDAAGIAVAAVKPELKPEPVAANVPKEDAVKAEQKNESPIQQNSSSASLKKAAKAEKPEKIVPVDYKPPVVISQVKPDFPRIATQIRESGSVVLDLNINEKGQVTDAEPVSGPEVFYKEAVRSVLLWKFKPATRNGEKTDSRIKVTINFKY